MKKLIVTVLVVVGLVVVIRKLKMFAKDVVDVYGSFMDDEPVGIG